ncbi:AraC family transcriptional regulator [Cohnella hongkongensis]|uniref:AraC family transcriptional regulator n=1 Tax=Cohnella hongkongensis TaxID=178337 RepID=A0ABV9FI99_9BACL
MTGRSEFMSRLAGYLYKLEEVQRIAPGGVRPLREAEMYGLLLFREAQGSVSIGGQSYSLRRSQIFLLPPGADVRWSVPPNERTEGYDIRFRALQPTGDGHFVPAELDCPVEYEAAYVAFDRVEEMEKMRGSGGPWNDMKANILFQELIAELFQDAGRERAEDLGDAIQRTLDYMKNHYPLYITREKLADMAGVSADYYSKAFKKRLNKSPIEYLTDIRIAQAKRLLAQSGESLRSIAQRVGFSDEFYFSRKFKAEIGCSPRTYALQLRRPPSSG